MNRKLTSLLILTLLPLLACLVQLSCTIATIGSDGQVRWSSKAVLAVTVPTPATPVTDNNERPSQTPHPTAASATPQPQTCLVTTGYETGWLNLRRCPSTSCTILLVLPEGSQVQPLTTASNWTRVTTSYDLTGWIYSTYINCEGD